MNKLDKKDKDSRAILSPEESNIVYKDNPTIKIGDKIVRAQYSFTLMQHRLNNSFLALIDRESDTFSPCSASMERIAELMGLTADGHNKQAIRRTIAKMGGCYLSWTDVDQEHGDCGSVPWFAYVRFRGSTKTVEWQYNPALGSELLQLRARYTSEELLTFQRFKYSGYSDRIAKIIIMGAKDTTIDRLYYDLDELRAVLAIPKDAYPRYGNLNIRVLKPVERDINEFTDYRFYFDPVYRGRKVVGVSLVFRKKEKETIYDREPWRDKLRIKLIGLGVNVYKAVSISKNEKYSEGYISANVAMWEQATNIQDPAAALVYYITQNKAKYKVYLSCDSETEGDNGNNGKDKNNNNEKPASSGSGRSSYGSMYQDEYIRISGMNSSQKARLLDDMQTSLIRETDDDVYDTFKMISTLQYSDLMNDQYIDELLTGYSLYLQGYKPKKNTAPANIDPNEYETLF